jgi:hypothetical protein
MDALADIDVTALGRLLGGLEGADADDSALDLCTLDVDLRRSYRRALVARDEAAAYLVANEGWSYSDAAQATCGHRDHAERMHVVVDWTQTPDHLDRPETMLRQYQAVADRLRGLISRTHAMAVRALPATRIEHHMPSDPLERLAHCAHWLRYTDTYTSSLVASRNLYGAILVQHHNWQLRDVAGIARTDEDQIAVAATAAAHNPPSDADSGLLRELSAVADAMAYNTHRLEYAGREAVQQSLDAGVPRPVVAAYGGPLAD